MNSNKILLVVLIAALVIAWFGFGGADLLSFDAIKEQQSAWADYYQQHPVLAVSLFFVVYVLITALSLPGAALLTLLAGALFGFWVGLILVSFASSLGATLAFLTARYIARDWAQNAFAKPLATINEGLDKEGAFYLFSLRLVPVFPFFLINIAMGLTRFPVWPFYWVSQLGMLAGTAVYVNAGTQLASLTGLEDILSVPLMVSFCLLGVLPLVAKRALAWWRGRT